MRGPPCLRGMTIAYLGGIASRSERYMKAHWENAKGFLDAAGLDAEARREEADHIRLQQETGMDLLAPAYIRWEDLLRPLCREGTGAAPGQLTRYFETNTFYRQPHITGDLPSADPAAWFSAFQIPPGPPWALTLPSPWDFAVRSRNETSRSTAELALEAGRTLHAVVEAAFKRGATLVQFHDPSILYPRAASRDVKAFAAGLSAAAKGHEADCALHLTYGDPFAHPEVLEANPLGGLSIEDPGHAPPPLRLRRDTKLTLALVHGEESLVEDPAAMARRGQELAGQLGLPLWGLSNGWDLGHVPHAIAARKIQALGQARRLAQEVPA